MSSYDVLLCFLLLNIPLSVQAFVAPEHYTSYVEEIQYYHNDSIEYTTVEITKLFPAMLNSKVLAAADKYTECPKNKKSDEITKPLSANNTLSTTEADDTLDVFFDEYEMEILDLNDVANIELASDTSYPPWVKKEVPRKDMADSEFLYFENSYLEKYYRSDGNIPNFDITVEECQHFIYENSLPEHEKYWFMKYCEKDIRHYKHTFHSLEKYLSCKTRSYNLSECYSAINEEEIRKLYSCW
ncbi:uncharacterized protein LOC126327197 [Schistocerca gregaria]|uniref:uncharacterized protein LOC126327197 n=1 Tax=Schistocerca gregaria TaxID=7010 RepID=UPI00211E4A57|nr:uncharacterized protein LOC126327197 [Schistocerca gregaria]